MNTLHTQRQRRRRCRHGQCTGISSVLELFWFDPACMRPSLVCVRARAITSAESHMNGCAKQAQDETAAMDRLLRQLSNVTGLECHPWCGGNSSGCGRGDSGGAGLGEAGGPSSLVGIGHGEVVDLMHQNIGDGGEGDVMIDDSMGRRFAAESTRVVGSQAGQVCSYVYA